MPSRSQRPSARGPARQESAAARKFSDAMASDRIDVAEEAMAFFESLAASNPSSCFLSVALDAAPGERSALFQILLLDASRAPLLERLLRAGVSPDATSAARRPALVECAQIGDRSLPMLSALLDAGARLDATDKEGRDALRVARANGSKAIEATLLAHGARQFLPDVVEILADLDEPLGEWSEWKSALPAEPVLSVGAAQRAVMRCADHWGLEPALDCLAALGGDLGPGAPSATFLLALCALQCPDGEPLPSQRMRRWAGAAAAVDLGRSLASLGLNLEPSRCARALARCCFECAYPFEPAAQAFLAEAISQRHWDADFEAEIIRCVSAERARAESTELSKTCREGDSTAPPTRL